MEIARGLYVYILPPNALHDIDVPRCVGRVCFFMKEKQRSNFLIDFLGLY